MIPYDSRQVRRVVLVLLALTVMVPSLAAGATLYRCGHDATLRDHCCCAPKRVDRAAHGQAVRAACCCEIVRVDATPAPARERPAVAGPALAVPVVQVAIAVAAAPVRVARVDRPREAIGPPDPLFVVHCALLL